MTSDALEFGTRFHKHVETMDEKVWDGFKEEPSFTRDNRIKSKGVALGKLYIEHYLGWDTGKYKHIGWERAYGVVIDVDGRSVLVKGHIDQLMKDKETGLYWIKDLKTTAMYVDEKNYFSPWFLGGQGGYYSWLVGLEYGEENIGGVIVDVAMVNKKETDESCIKRKIMESQEINWQGVVEVARDWLRVKDRNVWRRSESSCVRYNKLCPFYLPCRHGVTDYWINQAKLRRKENNEWHR